MKHDCIFSDEFNEAISKMSEQQKTDFLKDVVIDDEGHCSCLDYAVTRCCTHLHIKQAA